MMKYLLVLFFLLKTTNAQLLPSIDTFRQGVSEWNIEKLKLAENSLIENKASDLSKKNYWLSVVYFYQSQYYLFGTEEIKNEDLGEKAIKLGIETAAKGLEIDSTQGELRALYATLLGLEIWANPWSVFRNGPKVFAAMNQALERDPSNPRIQYLIGVSYLFTPAILGGGSEEGRKYLNKSIDLYNSEKIGLKHPEEPKWGHSTAMGFIAFSYLREEKFIDAKNWIQMCKDLNPVDKVCLGAQKEYEEQLNEN